MTRRIDFDGFVLLDALGATPIYTDNGEYAVLLELGGRVNKSERRLSMRFLLAPGQAAELLANVTVAAQRCDVNFRLALEEALKEEYGRIRALEEEFRDD